MSWQREVLQYLRLQTRQRLIRDDDSGNIPVHDIYAKAIYETAWNFGFNERVRRVFEAVERLLGVGGSTLRGRGEVFPFGLAEVAESILSLDVGQLSRLHRAPQRSRSLLRGKLPGLRGGLP